MTPAKFTQQLHKEIVDKNMSLYSGVLENTKLADAADPHWRQLIALYSELTEQQRGVLMGTMRQVAIDTVSSMLAVLDGVERLEEQDGDLILSVGPSSVRLNGELQDQFLEIDEASKG